MKPVNFILAALILVLLGAAFFGGYKYYPLRKPCPQIASDTVYVRDTVIHYIPDTVPWYVYKTDTVIKTVVDYKDVDTMAILEDYFAIHTYTREWQDSLVHITLEDEITQNLPLSNNFSYRLLKPYTIINNVIDNRVTYNRYLYAGLSVPLNDYKYASTSIYFASDRLLLGVGLIPYSRGLSVTAGLKLIKFR